MATESWEYCYEAASNGLFLLTQIMTAFCVSRLCGYFIERKRRAWIAGFVYFCTMTVLYYIPVDLNNFMAYLAGVAAVFATLCRIDGGKIPQKVFLAVTLYAFRWISASAADVAAVFISEAGYGWIAAEQSAAGLYAEGPYFALYCGVGGVRLLFNFAILYLLVYAMGRILTFQYGQLKIRELLILIIPSALGMLNYAIVLRYNRAFQQDAGVYLSEAHPEIQLLWVLYQLLLAGGIFANLMLFQNLKEKQAAEHNRCLFLRQMDELQGHIETVEQIYNKIRGMKHDLNQHVGVLSGLLDRRQYAEAKDYLENLQAATASFDYRFKTGNPVTDVIVNEKARKAEQAGIAFETAFSYPVGRKVDAFDVSIILNNALENALAAAAGGYVNIRSYWHKNAFFMQVVNSCEGRTAAASDEERNFARTSVEGEHGFGLQNIRAAAQKYSGGMELSQQSREVRLTVMLLLDEKA